MMYTHDVTCNLSSEVKGNNDIYKKDQWKLKQFEKIVFWNKFYIIFHFLSLCAFISMQNIGRSIPVRIDISWFLLASAIFKQHVLIKF